MCIHTVAYVFVLGITLCAMQLKSFPAIIRFYRLQKSGKSIKSLTY